MNLLIFTYHFPNFILIQKLIDLKLRKVQDLFQSQTFILQGLVTLLNLPKFEMQDKHPKFIY